MFVLRKRINISIALIKEASKLVIYCLMILIIFHVSCMWCAHVGYEIFFHFCRAVGSIKAALFFPIFPWILQLGVFAWFIAVALYPSFCCNKKNINIVLFFRHYICSLSLCPIFLPWRINLWRFLVSNGTQKFHVIDKNGTIQNFTDCNPKVQILIFNLLLVM